MCSDAGHQVSSRPWRGFPIRTSSDHSPVIDSPRLIADSYVLLRLLMPRHPPCALKKLDHKRSKNKFSREPRTPNHTTHPERCTARPDPGSYSWKLLLIKDARVHYVVLKQQPRTTHPHTPPPTKGQAPMRSVQPGNQKQTKPTTQPTQPPKATHPSHGPVASGPNSVPNTKTAHPCPRTVPGHPPRKKTSPY